MCLTNATVIVTALVGLLVMDKAKIVTSMQRLVLLAALGFLVFVTSGILQWTFVSQFKDTMKKRVAALEKEHERTSSKSFRLLESITKDDDKRMQTISIYKELFPESWEFVMRALDTGGPKVKRKVKLELGTLHRMYEHKGRRFGPSRKVGKQLMSMFFDERRQERQPPTRRGKTLKQAELGEAGAVEANPLVEDGETFEQAAEDRTLK